MNVPEIVVCLKVVPRPEEVSVDPETLTLDRSGRSLINPADMHALETALRLKDRYGGTVRLLAMGPPQFEDGLRVALAMGADEAYLLSDRAFGGADTLATSYVLAGGVRKIGRFDLVMCGEESSDGATAQVPPGIAEWLDIPQITYATDVALVDSRWRVRATREMSGGHEVLVARLPAVLSVKMRANEPRFMDMTRRAWAAEVPVTIWEAKDIDADPSMIGFAGSATTVSGTHEAAGRDRRHELLTGTPAEQAHQLVEQIRPYLAVSRHGGLVDVRRPPGVTGRSAENGAQSAVGAAAPTGTTGRVPEPARAAVVQHEATWAGRAELLDFGGVVVAEVLTELWKDPSEGHNDQWGGEIRTELGGGRLPLEGGFALRLENDAEATAARAGPVRHYARNGLSGEEVAVHGQGPAPF
ncbi:MAG TPA: electron transfer flavoprotein subunit beta/FixA family protein [Dehalococcoidia bacterium]|nr:electron transfer flavoprotein subunit beta/FixA family protein [Dehalococcoidia bacterium]